MPNIYCLLLWWPLNERALMFELWEFHIEQQTNNELMNMSHFAYACKMRYPLNLVLENSEYLWFYWTYAL